MPSCLPTGAIGSGTARVFPDTMVAGHLQGKCCILQKHVPGADLSRLELELLLPVGVRTLVLSCTLKIAVMAGVASCPAYMPRLQLGSPSRQLGSLHRGWAAAIFSLLSRARVRELETAPLAPL